MLTLVDVEAPEADVTPMSPQALQLMMEQNHEAAEEGHKRLRSDFRSLESEVEQRMRSMERMIHAHDIELARPHDITKLQYPARFVVALAVISFGFGVGQYALNARL